MIGTGFASVKPADHRILLKFKPLDRDRRSDIGNLPVLLWD